MATTLDTNQLKEIKLGGATLTKQLTEACLKIGLSASNSKVTEFSATFQDDMNQTLFTGDRLRPGTTLSYGAWTCTLFQMDTGENAAGPTLSVKGRSSGVVKLEGQTGAKSWGNIDVATWVKQQAAAAGLKTIVQPGLGKASIVREKPDGDKKQSTWDVITQLAKQVGAWVFEYSNTLVFARPSWLKTRPGRRIFPFTISSWNNVTDSLAEVPGYKWDANAAADSKETLTVMLASADADSARPGDQVTISGARAGRRAGSWVVVEVAFTFDRSAPIKLTCRRAIDPEKQPPKPPPVVKKATGKKTTAGKNSGVRKPAPNTASKVTGSSGANSAAARALQSFAARYNGARLDYDGGYGAQCVDLAKAWNQSVVGGPVIRGNGKDWYRNCAASGAYISIPASGRARLGDIVTFGSSYGGGYGHVGVVVQDNGATIKTFDQLNGRTGYHTFNRRGIVGFSRPKKWA